MPTAMLSLWLLASSPAAPAEVTRDNTALAASGPVAIRAPFIADADDNGVIHIAADGVTLDFAGQHLHGAAPDTQPDQFKGVGIWVRAKNVTIRNARISGFRCAIYAAGADGLVLENCDVSGNFQQRLKSTPAAEDGADWLWPHRNDDEEWLKNYGAGIYVSRTIGPVVRGCRARNGQNGLILDRVTDAKVYDNDFSFLSGWGVAMWRSSRNTISRNALDFCVRGYSHGVYNRGQDSAGILMFEQCVGNIIAENSATHGGDGFFGFAGREALGDDWLEKERARLKQEKAEELAQPGPDGKPRSVDDLITVPPEVAAQHKDRGCNDNLLVGNDFSYAPAHGIEMTFSFRNRFVGNRLVENAICGVWGGYSQQTLILDNEFEGNGGGAYGMERGGVNIEHGSGNRIILNRFRNNQCGVHLWWDNDVGLLKTPWVAANGAAAADNYVANNRFEGDKLVLHLREAERTVFVSNVVKDVGRELDATPGSEPLREGPEIAMQRPEYTALGETRPVGARPELRGRDKIIVTEWGPYDWQAPYLQFAGLRDGGHVYRVFGRAAVEKFEASPTVRVERSGGAGGDGVELLIRPTAENQVAAYELTVQTAAGPLVARRSIVSAIWTVRAFNWLNDPREQIEAWRLESNSGVAFPATEIDFVFGGRGPSEWKGASPRLREARLAPERFGIVATTKLRFPAGKWKVSTTSDDGVRVLADGEPLIENWTWHVPTVDTATLTVDEEREIELLVEYFELDGHAVLQLRIEPGE